MYLPQTLSEFAQITAKINEGWEDEKSIDWQEAEDLVAMAKHLHEKGMLPSTLNERILEYVADVEDWDCGVVGNWPALIQSVSE